MCQHVKDKIQYESPVASIDHSGERVIVQTIDGERKKQIMEEAVNIIVTHGHVGLTMRAVARASGIKLGALQYHYPTRIDLVSALSDWISEQTAINFQTYSTQEHTDKRTLHALVEFLLEDPLEKKLDIGALFEQLWCMALTEPIVRELLDNLYTFELHRATADQAGRGKTTSRCVGLSIFIGRGRRWNAYAQSSVDVIHDFLEAQYPSKK